MKQHILNLLRGTVVTTVLLVATAWQLGPVDPPPADDPTHPGQPMFCQNWTDKTWRANCECQPKMGEAGCRDSEGQGRENPKCKVYCRKDHCTCSPQCTSHNGPGHTRPVVNGE